MVIEHCESICEGLECATADCVGVIVGECAGCGTPLCKQCLSADECSTCVFERQLITEPLSDSVEADNEPEIFRNGSHTMEVQIGTRFRLDGCIWELSEYLGRDHSFTTGSAPCFACELIEGNPPAYKAERYTSEGLMCFNTDAGNVITLSEAA